jgi:GntR family transcriptional repressor for pyruvate dehydrogenase complex
LTGKNKSAICLTNRLGRRLMAKNPPPQNYPQVFEPIEQKRTYKEIAEKIKQAIFEGKLNPGDKLPPEIELARQFNVGRQTIREALRILEISGFIAIRLGSNGGPIIKNTILNKVSESFLNAIKLEKVTLNDIARARLELEKSIIYYAIENAKDEDIQELQDNLDEAKKELSKDRNIFLLNVEFHKILAKASKNPVFVIVMEAVMAFGTEWLSRSNISIEKSRKAFEEHKRIIDAIVAKDSELATKLMEYHIKRVGKLIQ